MNFKTPFAILAISLTLAFAAEDPVQAIQKKDKELQTLIKKTNRTAKDGERIKNLLNESFDFRQLALKSLPKGVFDAQSKEDQEKFIYEFERMVRNSSAKRLEVYKADSTVYEAAKMKGNDEARVVAHLFNGGKEAVLEYRMTLTNGKWMAWDLIIDDLSTVRNYKDQFGGILKTKSFAELIDIVKNKADKE